MIPRLSKGERGFHRICVDAADGVRAFSVVDRLVAVLKAVHFRGLAHPFVPRKLEVGGWPTLSADQAPLGGWPTLFRQEILRLPHPCRSRVSSDRVGVLALLRLREIPNLRRHPFKLISDFVRRSP